MDVTTVPWRSACCGLKAPPRATDACSYCHRPKAASRCAKCKISICSAECQKAMYPQHRRWCNPISLLEALTDGSHLDRAIGLATLLKSSPYTKLGSFDSAVSRLRSSCCIKIEDPRQYEGEEHSAGAACASPVVELLSFFDAEQRIPQETGLIIRWERSECVQRTGCSIAPYLAFALCLHPPKNEIRGDLLAMMAIVTNAFADAQRDDGVSGIGLSPERTLEYQRQSLASLLRDAAATDRAVIYTLRLSTPGQQGRAPPAPFREAWAEITSRAPSLDHYMLLLRLGDSACLLQGYYGHYSYRAWAAFRDPLVRDPELPAPAAPGWLFDLDPRPRFRGLFPAGTMAEVAGTVDALAKAAPAREHAAAYRDLTGIRAPPERMPRSFRVLVSRLDLDHVAAKPL